MEHGPQQMCASTRSGMSFIISHPHLHGLPFRLRVREAEELRLLEAEGPGNDIVRDRLYERVKIPHDRGVVAPCGLDGVFKLFEVILKEEVVLVGLERGITLGKR